MHPFRSDFEGGMAEKRLVKIYWSQLLMHFFPSSRFWRQHWKSRTSIKKNPYQSAPHDEQSAKLFKLAWNPLLLSSAVALKTTLQKCMIHTLGNWILIFAPLQFKKYSKHQIPRVNFKYFEMTTKTWNDIPIPFEVT